MGATALHMLGTGRLHQTQQLTQQAILLGSKPGGFVLPVVGWPMVWQAEVLREWNQLEAARSLAEEAIQFCEQLKSPSHSFFQRWGMRYCCVSVCRAESWMRLLCLAGV